jgi:CRISPR-associated protein Csm3
MAKKFIANVIIKGKMETKTGLHIGGSKEKLEIGGVDSPVIRDPHTRQPYIPGSSLKGKMRMLLEFALGKVNPNGEPSEDDEIVRIFGTSAKERNLGPTRLIVRDAYPDDKTIDMWKNLDTELQYTELKPENSIDRITSEANPRFLERVVKGSNFDVEFVFSIYDWDDGGKTDIENLGRVFEALRLLEHSGIGGNVSRGYGRVEFELYDPIVVYQEDYRDKTKFEEKQPKGKLKPLSEIEIPEIITEA